MTCPRSWYFLLDVGGTVARLRNLLLSAPCLCGVFTSDSVPPLDVYATVNRTTEVTFEGVVTYPSDDFLGQLSRWRFRSSFPSASSCSKPTFSRVAVVSVAITASGLAEAVITWERCTVRQQLRGQVPRQWVFQQG